MKKHVLLFVLALTGVLDVVAQADYQPGYVVTHAADTLKGSVLLPKAGLARYEACTFKNEEGNVTTYRPADVSAYGLVGGSFYQGVANRNQFMEVLVLGRLDLLTANAKIFLCDTTGKLHELVNTTKQVERNGAPYVQDQKEYIGILRWLMADCGQVKGRIDNTSLSAPALTKLVSHYNECVEGKRPVVRQRSKPVIWQIGAMAMYTSGTIKGMNSDIYVWPTGSGGGAGVPLRTIADYHEISSVTSTGYGLYLNAALPGVYKGLSIAMEGYIQRYELSSSHVEVASSTRTYNNSIFQKVKSVKVPLYVQHEWTGRRRVQPLLFIGAGFNFNSGNYSNTLTGSSKEEPAGYYTSTIQYTDVFKIHNFALAVLGGVGVAVRFSDRLSIELKGRYESGKGPIQLSYVSHGESEASYRLTSASVSLRYCLSKP